MVSFIIQFLMVNDRVSKALTGLLNPIAAYEKLRMIPYSLYIYLYSVYILSVQLSVKHPRIPPTPHPWIRGTPIIIRYPSTNIIDARCVHPSSLEFWELFT